MMDLIVVGAGPAGLAAAASARQHGLSDILIIERDFEPGGILNQCIHNGFGLHYFGEELTGPEYAARFVQKTEKISLLTDAMVLSLHPCKGHHELTVLSRRGYEHLKARAVILATGSRERTREALSIPGGRPSGIFTAGAAQRFVNIEGYMVGRRVLILGSGDIGLIMARRLTLEGADVLACLEIMPFSSGLKRNIVQCLNDFDIPLLLSHTITRIHGNIRVEGATIAKVDESRQPIAGTERLVSCDTILFSVGLLPENELARGAGICIDPRTNGAIVDDNMQTSVEGIYACGNAAHIHDLVDFVTTESERAGRAAAEYVRNGKNVPAHAKAIAGEGVSYVLPQRICGDTAELFFRVKKIYDHAAVVICFDGTPVLTKKRDIMAPGEMERIPVQHIPHNTQITVSIKESL